MKLRVEMRPADSKGQRVTTEDGEMIEGIKTVKWSADAVQRPTVIVELYAERVTFDLTSVGEEAQVEEPNA